MDDRAPPAWQGHFKFAFCLLLHLLLVACHAALVVIGHDGHPLHLVQENWYTFGIFYIYNFGPNLVGKAYLVLLLWFTQKLALRRNLHKKQRLTAIHDQATAWLGLGSAIPVLLTQAFPVVTLLPLVDWDISTLGWQDYLIYDIPNFFGMQSIQVAVTQVQVQCNAIPNATQSGDFNTTSGTFSFQIDPRIEDISVAPTNRALYVLPLNLKNASGSASIGAPPSTMIVASTMNIEDDVNQFPYSVIQFNPAVVPDTCQFQSECSQLSSLQLLACNTNFSNITMDAIPQYGLTNDSTYIPPTSGWRNWTLPASPRDIALSSVNLFGDLSPRSNTVQNYHTAGGDFTGNYTFSMLEVNLMDALRFDHEDVTSVSLGQLEAMLQNAIAAVYWRASIRMALEAQLPLTDPVSQYDPRTLGAPFRYSLQITKWPPIVGLATSVLLLVLALILTRHAQPKSASQAKLDTTGVLQITWLLGTKNGPNHETEDAHYSSGKNIANTLRSKAGAEMQDLREKGRDIEVDGWGYTPSE
ncbi:hypothetical protein BC835DRAFT_1416597 [Cytidiella melzeri]|nr:hypothetical protein BC835DRAFT_1416597 [Cytidiella melzeri]